MLSLIIDGKKISVRRRRLLAYEFEGLVRKENRTYNDNFLLKKHSIQLPVCLRKYCMKLDNTRTYIMSLDCMIVCTFSGIAYGSSFYYPTSLNLEL